MIGGHPIPSRIGVIKQGGNQQRAFSTALALKPTLPGWSTLPNFLQCAQQWLLLESRRIVIGLKSIWLYDVSHRTTLSVRMPGNFCKPVVLLDVLCLPDFS
jgi:hypothetical protein